MATLSNAEVQDPFDWSIDEVILQMCQNATPAWSPGKPPLYMTNVGLLERALRDNDIDGESLLALDEPTIKNDLGIMSFGQRRAIRKAVEFIRATSTKYQHHQHNVFRNDALARMQSAAFVTPRMTTPLISTYDQSPAFGAFGIQSTIEAQQAHTSPSPNAISTMRPREMSMDRTEPLLLQTSTNIQSRDASESTHINEQNGRVAAASEVQGASWNVSKSRHETFEVQQHVPRHPTLLEGSHQHGDKGVASDDRTPLLDALEASVDKSLGNDNPAVDSIRGALQDAQASLQQSTPRVVHQRKRLVPTLVSPSDVEAGIASKPVTLSTYFHPKPIEIQDLFYPGVADADHQFTYVRSSQSTGYSKYVATAMKHFLREPVRPLPNSETTFKIPYRRSLLLSQLEPQYFTMFAPGLEPAVRPIEGWSSLKDLQKPRRCRARASPSNWRHVDQDDEHPATISDPFQFEEASDPDVSHYDYLIEKYPPQNDGEDVLPVFGDSDDEWEYDDETLAEIQRDQAEGDYDSNKGLMKREEVEAAIDESIAELKEIWRETKLPRVQMKAYRLWMKAARERSRQFHMDIASHWVERFEVSIEKIRAAILKDRWRRVTEVKHQCQSLEQSVYQQAEYQHLIEVLNETYPPMRPDRATLRKSQALQRMDLPEGEQILDSDTDASLEAFIADDDDSSDANSIPHNNLDQDWDSTLPHLRQDGTRRNLGDVSFPPEDKMPSSPSDQLGCTSTPPPGLSRLVEADLEDSGKQRSTPSVASESSEGFIMSSVDKRKMSKAAALASADQLVVAHYTTNGEEDASGNAPLDTNDGEADSDLDRPPPLPKTQYRERGTSKTQAIDLTLSSSPSRAEKSGIESTTDFDVQTPDLNPIDGLPRRNPRLKLDFVNGRISGSDSARSSPRFAESQRSDSSGLPALDDIQGIRQLEWDIIEEHSDRRRALAKAVYEMVLPHARKIFQYASAESLYNVNKGRDILHDAVASLYPQHSNDRKIPPHIRRLALLFVSFVCHANLMDEEDASPKDVNEAYGAVNNACVQFLATLDLVLDAYCSQKLLPSARSKKRKIEDSVETDREDLADDSDIYMQSADSDSALVQPPDEPSSHKKRKRAVAESQEAKHLQMSDQLRVQEHERRKIAMAQKLQSMAITSDNPATHFINTLDPEICLDAHIGRRVKPHQVDGISFMWREIVADPKRQGCLLAHTMGLGKTMQVISLLYTIAQSAKSTDPRIVEQVPKELRRVRALILCPPSLIDNWYDELLMWVPDHQVLGDIWKVTSRPRLSTENQLQELKEWARSGGVLIMSYEKFRILILNGSRRLEDEEHREFERLLLSTPNIVVADEAHKMKNEKSMIAKVAKRIETTTRIALTGSPLNNHLEEYHTMIDWIAPGYLGSLVQFKAKYSEPIKEGLYADSSQYEKRLSLRKLHILKRDLDPKISRADISAIEKDMPSKTEFFITLELTHLQKQAYNAYVDAILSGVDAKQSYAKLWNWLGVLQLLCNHPSCFVNKLRERENHSEDESKSSENLKKTTDDDDDSVELPDDMAAAEMGLTLNVMNEAIDVYSEIEENDLLSEIELSHRSFVVHQIIRKSCKIGDQVLVFSHSIPTLNYLEEMLRQMKCVYSRIDGTTNMSKRQEATKSFNKKTGGQQVFLISMRAGGLGLNLQGANRVIIFDFSWNPTWEEQAIGRAYRLGQTKPVFVYRFRTGGTFEDVTYNKAVFKTQLFSRVVDKKNYVSNATKKVSDYFFHARDVHKEDFSESMGKDINVLDRIISQTNCIRNIELTETFQKEDDEDLTPDERKAADEEYTMEVLQRNDPVAYHAKMAAKQQALLARPVAMSRPVATPKSLLQLGAANVRRQVLRQNGMPVESSGMHSSWPPLPGLVYLEQAAEGLFADTPSALNVDDGEIGAYVHDTQPLRSRSQEPEDNFVDARETRASSVSPGAKLSTGLVIPQSDGAFDDPEDKAQHPLLTSDDPNGCKTQ